MNNQSPLNEQSPLNDFLQQLITGISAKEFNPSPKTSEKFSPYARYLNDPILFFTEVLGETLTNDTRNLISSVIQNKITVGISATGTGKSWTAARLALLFYKAYPNSQVYLSAAPPIGNLERILWGELLNVIHKHPKLFHDDVITKLSVRRSPLSFIQGISIPASLDDHAIEARFSGKHAPNMLFIFDEADAIPEAVYKGVDGCMSGGNTRLLLLFNPRKNSGYVPSLIKSGEANVVELSAIRHPNVVTGDNMIAGAVDRPATLARIYRWTREVGVNENVDEESSDTFQVPAFLNGLSLGDNKPLKAGNRVITNSEFNYKVLGRFPSTGEDALIPEEAIDNAMKRWVDEPPARVKPFMGIDVGEYGKDGSCVCLRYGHHVARFITWTGINTLRTADKAAEIIKQNDVVATFVDSNGLGAGVQPRLKEHHVTNVHRVMVQQIPKNRNQVGRKVEFGCIRDELWWNLRDWLIEDPNSSLPPDDELKEELMAASYKEVFGKIKICDKAEFKKKIKRSPNKADALCLTFAPTSNFSYYQFNTFK